MVGRARPGGIRPPGPERGRQNLGLVPAQDAPGRRAVAFGQGAQLGEQPVDLFAGLDLEVGQTDAPRKERFRRASIGKHQMMFVEQDVEILHPVDGDLTDRGAVDEHLRRAEHFLFAKQKLGVQAVNRNPVHRRHEQGAGRNAGPERIGKDADRSQALGAVGPREGHRPRADPPDRAGAAVGCQDLVPDPEILDRARAVRGGDQAAAHETGRLVEAVDRDGDGGGAARRGDGEHLLQGLPGVERLYGGIGVGGGIGPHPVRVDHELAAVEPGQHLRRPQPGIVDKRDVHVAVGRDLAGDDVGILGDAAGGGNGKAHVSPALPQGPNPCRPCARPQDRAPVLRRRRC